MAAKAESSAGEAALTVTTTPNTNKGAENALVASTPVERARIEAAGVEQDVTRVDHFPENLQEMRRVLSSFVERREYIQRDRRVPPEEYIDSLYALVIGVEHSQEVAYEMNTVLREFCGYQPPNIAVLTTESIYPNASRRGDAELKCRHGDCTRKRILAEFSRLSHRVTVTGTILVYIGGRICTDGQVVPRKREEPHDPETDAIEALKVDGDVYICTPKAGSHGMLSCRDLSKAINALQTKGVLVVLDGFGAPNDAYTSALVLAFTRRLSAATDVAVLAPFFRMKTNSDLSVYDQGGPGSIYDSSGFRLKRQQLQEIQNKRSNALMQVVVRCLHLLSLEKVNSFNFLMECIERHAANNKVECGVTLVPDLLLLFPVKAHNMFALIVCPCPDAEADARALQKVLLTSCGYADGDVILATGHSSSKAAITEQLSTIRAHMATLEAATLVFFFLGEAHIQDPLEHDCAVHDPEEVSTVTGLGSPNVPSLSDAVVAGVRGLQSLSSSPRKNTSIGSESGKGEDEGEDEDDDEGESDDKDEAKALLESAFLVTDDYGHQGMLSYRELAELWRPFQPHDVYGVLVLRARTNDHARQLGSKTAKGPSRVDLLLAASECNGLATIFFAEHTYKDYIIRPPKRIPTAKAPPVLLPPAFDRPRPHTVVLDAILQKLALREGRLVTNAHAEVVAAQTSGGTAGKGPAIENDEGGNKPQSNAEGSDKPQSNAEGGDKPDSNAEGGDKPEDEAPVKIEFDVGSDDEDSDEDNEVARFKRARQAKIREDKAVVIQQMFRGWHARRRVDSLRSARAKEHVTAYLWHRSRTFSRQLLLSLRGAARSGICPDFVTVHSLYNCLLRRMRKADKYQRPLLVTPHRVPFVLAIVLYKSPSMGEVIARFGGRLQNAERTIGFGGQGGGVAIARALEEALPYNEKTEELVLYDNLLGDEGCEVIARMLKTDTHIKAINIVRNRIWDAGAEAINEMLWVNKSLQYLNFAKNKISIELKDEIKTTWKLTGREPWKLLFEERKLSAKEIARGARKRLAPHLRP